MILRKGKLFAGLLVALVIAGTFPARQAAGAETVPAAPAEGPAGLAGLLEQARTLLARKNPAEAHALLSPQVRWYAGSPEFDYLLGISALDSGRPGEAILAFERVLSVQPDHLQARAEIARAYLAVNERESARRQFELVASNRIPAEVRRVIDSYLALIARGEGKTGPQLLAYLEFGAGWDSNVSLGSLSDQWLLGSGMLVAPIGLSRPVESAVMLAGGAASLIVPMGGGWDATAGGQFIGRWYTSAHTLDIVSTDLFAGLNYQTSCHQFSMLAQYQNLRLDSSRFRDADGALLQWRCDVDARNQVGAYAQHFNLRYLLSDARDARRDVVGVTGARLLGKSSGPVLVASVYGGEEVPRQDIAQLRYTIGGARAAVTTWLGNGWRGSASVSFEHRNYAGEEPLFGTVRRDRQMDIRIGADRRLGRNWTLHPELVYTRNASTLAPNDFRRVQALVTARYGF